VNEQGAAAGLFVRGDDFAAFGGKDTNGRGVYLREKFALHAAEKEPDAAAFCALRGSNAGNRFTSANLRHQRFHRS
jgi:hypothetical protein